MTRSGEFQYPSMMRDTGGRPCWARKALIGGAMTGSIIFRAHVNDLRTERAPITRDRFAAVPFEDKGGSWQGRYYQDIAVARVLEAIAPMAEGLPGQIATPHTLLP